MGGSRVLKECIIKKDKRVDHQVWTTFQISESKMAKLGLFPSNVLLLECISAIIDFDVLCTWFLHKWNIGRQWVKVDGSTNFSH